MIDWNGNGKIDPSDIAISIAVDSSMKPDEDEADFETVPIVAKPPTKSLWDKIRNWLNK